MGTVEIPFLNMEKILLGMAFAPPKRNDDDKGLKKEAESGDKPVVIGTIKRIFEDKNRMKPMANGVFKKTEEKAEEKVEPATVEKVEEPTTLDKPQNGTVVKETI